VRIFAAGATIVLLFLAGCDKKTLSKSELRAITGEIVSTAQKISGHKSEIAIRPELQPAKHGSASALAADNIYISLSDPSQTAAFAQALQAIARKHDLSITETASSGVIRFDCAFRGARTHTVHVVTPLAARAAAHAPAPTHQTVNAGTARLAIIINSTITGTATMPLITAAQMRASTGLSAATLAPAPRSVATAMAP